MKNFKVIDMVQIAIVIALYVIITVVLGPLGSGAVQFRLSELFNFLAFYNRKYIWAVTIGCMISNYMVFGIVDVIVWPINPRFRQLRRLSFQKYMTKDAQRSPTKHLFTLPSSFLSRWLRLLRTCDHVPSALFLTWLTSSLELLTLDRR